MLKPATRTNERLELLPVWLWAIQSLCSFSSPKKYQLPGPQEAFQSLLEITSAIWFAQEWLTTSYHTKNGNSQMHLVCYQRWIHVRTVILVFLFLLTDLLAKYQSKYIHKETIEYIMLHSSSFALHAATKVCSFRQIRETYG